MTLLLDAKQKAKLLDPAVLRIMAAFRSEKLEARVVGGAVRDVVISRNVGDIDLATNAPPHRVMEILAHHGIKTVPTGLAHGTITAVVDHIGYEITTLRRDVTTDGRHAEVIFTDDWCADAARRDFTFNALYCDAEGKLYDYFEGVADAKDGQVRFIGDAQTRIREDILRILRFFRFFAWFGLSGPDSTALFACRNLADLIPQLSVERVAKEILKLLGAENPVPSWQLMIDNGIVKYIAPEATDITRIQTLLENEKRYDSDLNALLRFAALLPPKESVAMATATHLKFSKRDNEKLCAYARLAPLMHDKLDPIPLRRTLYSQGAENCRAALLLLRQEISEPLAIVAAWENPKFPIQGEDIIKRGIAPGPQVGKALGDIEAWWISNDFRPDRAACLEQIKKSA